MKETEYLKFWIFCLDMELPSHFSFRVSNFSHTQNASIWQNRLYTIDMEGAIDGPSYNAWNEYGVWTDCPWLSKYMYVTCIPPVTPYKQSFSNKI